MRFRRVPEGSGADTWVKRYRRTVKLLGIEPEFIVRFRTFRIFARQAQGHRVWYALAAFLWQAQYFSDASSVFKLSAYMIFWYFLKEPLARASRSTIVGDRGAVKPGRWASK